MISTRETARIMIEALIKHAFCEATGLKHLPITTTVDQPIGKDLKPKPMFTVHIYFAKEGYGRWMVEQLLEPIQYWSNGDSLARGTRVELRGEDMAIGVPFEDWNLQDLTNAINELTNLFVQKNQYAINVLKEGSK